MYSSLMDFRVYVNVGSKTPSVARLNDGRLRVSVRSKAKNGKANEEVRAVLSEYFGVSKDNVHIVRGSTSPRKTIRTIGGGPQSRM